MRLKWEKYSILDAFLKKKGRKNTPIRYVVEHVYSGTESMEGLLTVVSEEAARKNVEEKLRNGSMGTGKKAV